MAVGTTENSSRPNLRAATATKEDQYDGGVQQKVGASPQKGEAIIAMNRARDSQTIAIVCEKSVWVNIHTCHQRLQVVITLMVQNAIETTK